MPPQREVPPGDRTALLDATRAERRSREDWEASRVRLEDAIRIAVANGGSLRAVAELVGFSHGRVRDIVQRMPLLGDEYYQIIEDQGEPHNT